MVHLRLRIANRPNVVPTSDIRPRVVIGSWLVCLSACPLVCLPACCLLAACLPAQLPWILGSLAPWLCGSLAPWLPVSLAPSRNGLYPARARSDVYVNDAFGTSHRSHSSMLGKGAPPSWYSLYGDFTIVSPTIISNKP